jgi:hypothetical protein
MRRHDDVGQRLKGQPGGSAKVPGVNHCATDPLILQRVVQCLLVYHGSARDIDQDCMGAHRGERRGVDDSTRFRRQWQSNDNTVHAAPECRQFGKTVSPVDKSVVGHRAAIGDMNQHVECLRAGRDSLADMSEPQYADGRACHLLMRAIRGPCPVCPLALAQPSIRIREGNMALKQRRHHVFRDGVLVPEAIAHDRCGRQRVEIDHVVAGARHLIQAQPVRPWQRCVEPGADDDVGAGERLAELAGSTDVWICASETLGSRFPYKDMLDHDAMHVVMVDLCWTGGLTEGRKIAAMADTYHRPFAPHDCTGPIGFVAALHTSFSQPNTLIQESVRAFYTGWYKELVTELPVIRDGYALPMEGPGLGTELQPAVFKRSDLTVRRSEAS